MGYYTYLSGELELKPHLNDAQVAYLTKWSDQGMVVWDEQLIARCEDPLREAVGLPVGTDGMYYTGPLTEVQHHLMDALDQFVAHGRPGQYLDDFVLDGKEVTINRYGYDETKLFGPRCTKPPIGAGNGHRWVGRFSDYLQGPPPVEEHGCELGIWRLKLDDHLPYSGWADCYSFSNEKLSAPEEQNKYYAYDEWLLTYVERFLKPWGITANGCIHFEGEDPTDIGYLDVSDNEVTIAYRDPDAYLPARKVVVT